MNRTSSLRQLITRLALTASTCICPGATPLHAGAAPSVLFVETVAPDQYTSSPGLQAHSRTGARFESSETPSESPNPEAPVDGGEMLAQQVDINSASADELAALLPGIGPSKARAIVEWRATNGLFQSIEQLLEVSGIGPATLENVRPFVYLGNALSLGDSHWQFAIAEARVIQALAAVIGRAERDRRRALSALADSGDSED